MNNLEHMDLSELDELEVRHRACASFSDQVACIMGLEESPVPDLEHDAAVAYKMENWLLDQGCHIQRDLRYPEISGKPSWAYSPERYHRDNRVRVTLVSGPAGANFHEQRADHNLALCWAVLKYLTKRLASFDEPDTYCGRDPLADTAQSLDWEKQARQTIHNPKGR